MSPRAQQRHQARRDAASLIWASASMAGNARKKSSRLGDVGERVDGVGGAQPAERFDGVEADVDVGIVQRADQRVDGGRVLLLAERQRRLDAQVGVRLPAAARRAAR